MFQILEVYESFTRPVTGSSFIPGTYLGYLGMLVTEIPKKSHKCHVAKNMSFLPPIKMGMVSYIPPIKMPVWLGDGKHEIVLPALNIINLCKNGRRSLAWIYPSHRSLSRCFWSSKAFSVSSLPAISKAWKRWRRQNLWRMTWTSYLSYLVAPSPPLWNNKP